jgi:hypothetical protein
METTNIMKQIRKEVISQLDQLLKPFLTEYDIILLLDILNGKKFQNGKILLTIRIGSGRRLNVNNNTNSIGDVFYDEIKMEIRATSKKFNFDAFIYYNNLNKTEGFSYSLNPELEINDLFDETIVLPPGNKGRKAEYFFDDFLKLFNLNRDIRIESCIEGIENK